MGLNQRISLILSAEDKGQAAFSSFLKGITGLGEGSEKTRLLLLKQMQVSNDLAVAQQNLAIADQKLIDSTTRIALANDRATLSTKAYNNAIASQKTLTEANAAVQDKMFQQQLKIDRAQKSLADKRKVATVVAPYNVETSLRRAANAQQSDYALQEAIVRNRGVSPIKVATASAELSAAQASGMDEVAYEALQQRHVANGILLDDQLRLTKSSAVLATADGGVVRALMAQNAANRAVSDSSVTLLAQQQIGVDLTNSQVTAGQLLATQTAEATVLKTKETEAILANNTARIAQLTNVRDANVAENTNNKLLAEQALLNKKTTAGGYAQNVAGAGLKTVAGAGAILLVEASKKASQFTSTEAQVAAATGTPLKDVQEIGQAILASVATGKSQYSTTQLLQGAVVPLNLQLTPDVVSAIVPVMAKAASVVKSPDMSSISQAVIAQVGYLGKHKLTTANDINQFLSTDVMAENRTGASPGAVIAAIPSLLAGINQSGIGANVLGMNQAMGLQTELVNASGVSPQKVSTWIGQMVRSAITKPNPQATAYAKSLGISQDFGSAAFRATGSNIFTYLQNLSNDISGPHKGEIAQRLLGGGMGGSGILAAKAFLNLTAGTNLERAAGFTDEFNKSQGVITQDTNALLQGQQQQQIGLLNKFNGDLVNLGIQINEKVVPTLLKMGDIGVQAMTDVLNSGKKTKDNPAGGDMMDTLLAYITPGTKSFIFNDPSGANARNASATGEKGSGFIPSLGNFVRRILDTGGGSTGFTLQDFGLGSITAAQAHTAIVQQAHIVAQRGMGLQIQQQSALEHNRLYPNDLVPVPGVTSAQGSVVTATPTGIKSTPVKPVVDVHIASVAPHINVANEAFGQAIGGRGNLVFNTNQRSAAAYNSLLDTPNVYSQAARERVAQTKVATTALNAAFMANQQSIDAVAAFRKDYKTYNTIVAGISVGTNDTSSTQLAKLRDKLFKELGSLPVQVGLGPGAKGVTATDAYTIQAGYLKTVFTRQLNAANIELSNAQARQSALAQSNASLAAQDAAAVTVYNKQLALIAVEEKTGQLKKTDATTARLVAKTTEQTTLGTNLAPLLAEAQAKLSLAQATGLGIPNAEKDVAKILREQAADHVIGPNALKLALYQLHQTVASVTTPGPQLIRPNANVDTLTVGFMASASRISRVQGASAQERTLANAEATIFTLRQALSIAQQQLSEDRKGTTILRSIDNKTPKRSDQSADRASSGGIGSWVGKSSAGSIRSPW
jgi:hypothetical protein